MIVGPNTWSVSQALHFAGSPQTRVGAPTLEALAPRGTPAPEGSQGAGGCKQTPARMADFYLMGLVRLRCPMARPQAGVCCWPAGSCLCFQEQEVICKQSLPVLPIKRRFCSMMANLARPHYYDFCATLKENKSWYKGMFVSEMCFLSQMFFSASSRRAVSSPLRFPLQAEQ